jgi:hypothetical protein
MVRSRSAAVLIVTLVGLTQVGSALGSVNLPDISVTLSGGTYPVHLQATTATGPTTLSTANGAVLTGTGATLLLLATELSALGTFTITFTNNLQAGSSNKCNSPGDAAGAILVNGEFHLVPVGLSPLKLGILFLVSTFTVLCESGIEIMVRGNFLGTLSKIGSEATELTEPLTEIEGERGRQNVSEYYNDGGTKVKAKLETEAGIGFVASAIDIGPGLGLAVLGSQMIVITNR